MSFVHEAQCDQCGKRETAGDGTDLTMMRSTHERYPGHWLVLVRAEQLYEFNRVPELTGLCSWDCVAAYGKKRAEPVW